MEDNSTAENEVGRYLALEQATRGISPLQWWKDREMQFPLLSQAAKKYLAIQASSAASERVFSRMNVVKSKSRASLAPERTEALVFIRRNLPHLSIFPQRPSKTQ